MNIPKDKQLHLIAGFIAGVVGAAAAYFLFREPAAMLFAAVAVAAVAGWAKEHRDRRDPENHTYDPADARYTTIGGVVAGVVAVAATHFFGLIA